MSENYPYTNKLAAAIEGRSNYADLISRLKKRAGIRRQAVNRKSVQQGEPDRIADLLEEAAKAIEDLLKRSEQ